MKPEENQDEGLLLDWRGGPSSATECQQSTLPFKQKKTAISSGAASIRVRMTSVTATGSITLAKHESTTPVMYDLSDSEVIPVRSLTERRAAAKLPSSSIKQYLNADVVTLASDSEEDVPADGAVKSSDKVEKPGQTRTQEGSREMFISFDVGEDEVGSKFCGRADGTSQKCLRPHELVHEKDWCSSPVRLTLDDLIGSISNATDAAFKVAAVQGSPRRNDTSPMAGPSATWSSPVQAVLEDLIGDVNSCSSGPECLQAHEPVSLRGSLNSRGSATQNFGGQVGHVQCLPHLARNSQLTDHAVGKENPFQRITGLSTDEYRKTTVSSGAKDLESERWILNGDKAKRKHSKAIGVAADTWALNDVSNSEKTFSSTLNVSKASEGPVPKEKAAAKEVQRQREPKLKKVSQQEDENEREEKNEGPKKRKVVATEQKGAAERRNSERELQKGNSRGKKGKSSIQKITVHLDASVVEIQELGALIIRQLGLKGYKYKVGSNPIERTIVWKMEWTSAESQVDSDGFESPADDIISLQLSSSQVVLEEVELKYIVVVIQAEEFVNLLSKEQLHAYICSVRNQYPTYSVCALINGLMQLLHKKDQHRYRTGDQSWTRPNVEKALAEFISHHPGVHSRLCIDESEIADHLVGLTRCLAECPFKKKLTSTSVKSKEDHVTKDIIKKSAWLKFLVAIPHVSGAIALVVSKEYPTMRSLLNAYLDPLRTVHEKEQLLRGLLKNTVHGVAGSDQSGRRIGPVVSKRIYQSLMGKDGNLTTEGEEGTDHLT